MNKTTYINTDIVIDSDSFPNWSQQVGDDEAEFAFDRFEFTKRVLDPADYDKEDLTPEEFEEWVDCNLTLEEREEVPLMNALYYFPSQAEFEEEDRDLTVGSTTLLYDNWHQRWAVGMTGGGMDLSPDLAATFVNLGWGVPINLATYLRANYRAYINKELHVENCKAVGKAMEEYGEAMRLRGVNLLIEAANPNI